MKRGHRTVCVVLAITVLTAVAVCMTSAGTVKVTGFGAPGSTGWVGAGVDGGVLTTNMPGLSRTFPKGNPSPFGISSAYFRLGQYDADENPPMQRWLGTNDYAGTKITDITKLKYSAYMQLRGQTNTDQPFYPRQPVALRIVISKDGINNRYIMFRPWSTSTADKSGPIDGGNCQVWKEYDAMANDKYWYVCTDQQIMTNWAGLCALYQNATICTVAQVGPPGTRWDPPVDQDTATGCALNFVAGVQANVTSKFPDWWKEAYNFEGAMDKFIIRRAVDTEDTVYDFQTTSSGSVFNMATDPANEHNADYWPYYAMNNRDVVNQLVVGKHCYYENAPGRDVYYSCYENCCNPRTYDATDRLAGNQYTLANYNSAGQIIYGRVVAEGYLSSERFKIDDGSGKLIPVWAPGASAYKDDYVRVKGSMAFPQDDYAMDHVARWFPATFYSYGGVEVILE